MSPRPSRQLTLILRGLQLITAVVLVLAPIHLALKLLLLSGLLLQGVVSYQRLHGRSPHLPQQVLIDGEYRVRLVYADGRIAQTRLRTDSVISPVMLLLRFEGEGWWRQTSLLLGPDSLSADEQRRLRVLLRFGGSASDGPQKGA
jgi:hypothetical protein